MQGSRARGLLVVSLTGLALVAAITALRTASDPGLVAPWWPATTLATMALLRCDAHRALRALTATTAVGFFATGLLGGRGGLFSIGYAAANTVEAVLVLWWLVSYREGRLQLRVWADYRRWLTGLVMATAIGAALMAATMAVTDGQAVWRTLLFTFVTHLASQAVLLPLVLRRSSHRVRISLSELGLHLFLLAIGLAACVTAAGHEPVGFLVLPLLMWGASRFPGWFAHVELLGIAVGMAVLTALDRGPFAEVDSHSSVLDVASSAQVFVATCAVTAVAFAVSTSHLRDTLARIRDNETRLGQLMDSASGTAFIATAEDGTITWFSPGAEELLGWTEQELVGRATPMLFHDPDEVRERAAELGVPATSYDVVTRTLADNGQQDTRDWTYLRRDGTPVTVSVSVSAVSDDSGRPRGHFSVVRDVSARRAAEEALMVALDKEREAHQRLHDLERVKGDFVSSVSHELRTPLTSIMGYTEILSEGLTGELSDTQQDLIEKIDRNSTRLLKLVEDLLTLTQVEKGGFEQENVPTDLCASVIAAADGLAATAQQRRVRLAATVPPFSVTVLGDAINLERLVSNLVSNAVKYTEPGGSVEVGLTCEGENAVVTVADTGLGIPLAEQDQLFQRFFRSSIANELAIQGTGLGLSIVQSIASAHGGHLEFESAPGVGTTFRFLVPLEHVEMAPVIPLPSVQKQQLDRRIQALFAPGGHA